MSAHNAKSPPASAQPEATVLYEPRGAAAAEPLSRSPKLFRLTSTSARDNSELQNLLRQRLRYIATMMAIASGLGSTQKMLSMPLSTYPSLLEFARAVARWPDLAVSLVNIFGFAVMGAILWRKSLPSLRGLRFCELLIFGELLVSICINNLYVLNTNGWLAELFRLQHHNILATWQSFPWFAIITAYGTLIPNTGRRCALVVGFFALFALAIAAGSLAANLVSGAEIFRYLLQMGVAMMLAVAIAIVGSHRLEKLRLEASEARRLGQYQLKERLGAGGMGEVYLAEHMLLRRPCAVKLINPEKAGDLQQRRRFEREVQTTASLSHPNTVQIFDYGHAEDGTFYYAMEYLPGQTLEQLVERLGPLAPARAIHFLRQLCGSLSEAHAVGLIHRDIKPGNVLICERGGMADVAKLLDFGLVQPTGGGTADERLTQEGTVPGTPAYMSPEQSGGHEGLDARSDIYSVGALGYFLLTGRSPFAGRSPLKMLAAHLYEPPTPPTQIRPDIPPDLEAVVLRCLAKDPAARYPDAKSLEKALAACQAAGAWPV
ncbi:MAG TPA: serine/threonine-protein kinase [Isosphaeraceae bacterium]|nr:serine/threonine-protein kinase [Isosphaeraceae bacterium]